MSGPRGRAFAISVALNVAFVAVEVIAGAIASSVALVADAAHNAADVLGLLLAWLAAMLAKRRPSVRRTYGLRRSTVLASLANAVLLLVGVGAVGWEAVGRLRSGSHVEGGVVAIVALCGVAVNGVSALLFARGRHADMNVRGAFLHLAADAGVSFGVVVAGALIVVTGWQWLDPLASLAVSAVVMVAAWSLLREALDLALDAVPEGIDPDAVRTVLATAAGVVEVHDMHIWAMSTTETALTAHLVMARPTTTNALHEIEQRIESRFGIQHTTLQVEADDSVCASC